ncbi:DUF1848 family protein [Treponema zioleckii]|uniref:DUF1848 family protein n=1 Tax=Treponema zioleckii TaxID=331680 RepID=UPI0018D705C1|nr:DUF1848 family protein [Treponema zioleckii]
MVLPLFLDSKSAIIDFMLLFASGRTDIPAFYSKWFVNRVRAGFVDVRNPYYGEQVTRYKLDPSVVDCLVFCTKNPAPILPYIDELKKFGLYFFVTVTPYSKEIEPNVPEKSSVIDSVLELSEKVGKNSVCWRYDPIFVDGENYTVSNHIKYFRQMAARLNSATDRCIISFVDLYSKTKKNFPDLKEVSENDQIFIAQSFSRIAGEYGMTIESCAEKLDLSPFGVEKGCCVGKEQIEKATGIRLLKTGKQNLRQHCLCLPTRDIGYYNSCPHLCKYCYANYDAKIVEKNYSLHDDESPFLIGNSRPDDVINFASQESWEDKQLLLF